MKDGEMNPSYRKMQVLLLLAYVFIIYLLDTFQGAPHCYDFTDFNQNRHFIMEAITPTHIWRISHTVIESFQLKNTFKTTESKG